ncbi:hypothetical protein GQ57_04820 [Burkholderia sp. MSh2]|uniref:Uncharacterized protein n=1 Tax=Burkholderia paludis TaxID=1506587 RepID=A0A6J5DBJ1_9BURK|nr:MULTISPECIES: hypothetical protein [Burkholderia]KEZ06732.1 hypothetical protein GQ57_04820 [Burkholderia sp. MSh2]CAB3751628.1 hypothetical protein LMG30113_01485 [Burkholderia paludis]VWB52618.1 hypothetical protein BPA30113_02284 [Burkholderia paludis]
MTQPIAELLAVLQRPVHGQADLLTLDDFFELTEVHAVHEQTEDRSCADTFLHACAAALPALHPNRAALLALLGGAIVERGADPRILFAAARAVLGAWLRELAPYCAQAVEEEDDEADDEARRDWHAARQRLDARDERQAWEVDALRAAVDTLVLPLMAMLMRDRDNHRDFVADAALQALLDRMADNDSLPFDQLHYLRTASALTYDPECVVVLPASGTGFVASAHAVNNTFHAFTLLQRLIGEHAHALRIGRPIAARIGDEEQDTSEFHWLQAHAYANGVLVDNLALAWGEAPLRNLTRKHGKCVLIALDTEEGIRRSWDGFNGVCHPAQNPSMTLVRFLTPAEVAGYLA